MKREIKYKALRADGKGWVYGMPTHDLKYMFNVEQTDSPDNYEIDPETVCQFTGLQDKNGADIYEGDKVKGGVRLMTVKYSQQACQFWLVWTKEGKSYYEPLQATSGGDFYANNGIEVIGNIHQTDKP